MNTPPQAAGNRFFQPLSLLSGVVLGMIALAYAGRAVTGKNWHGDFVRFHPMISPESQYEPTIAEMRAIVRSKCRPDRILVVVGGNSIFQGVGQPVEKLWTNHLQELLGDRYGVVNLAFRGSSPTDAAALVAESLREEYPNQIYLANIPPFTVGGPAGSLDYRFMFLDAWYKGWLIDYPARRDALEDYLDRSDLYPGAKEENLGARADALFWFREFWNWWSTTRFFTFPVSLASEPERAFRPRNRFKDQEPDFVLMPFSERFSGKFAETELNIVRNMTAQYYELDPAGGWRRGEFETSHFRKIASDAFPESLKARTLLVLSDNSPFYVRRLTQEEQERDALAYRECIGLWRELGYAATDYGTRFVEEDFGDRTHLTFKGGRKLAAHLAPEIRTLASRLGYPNP